MILDVLAAYAPEKVGHVSGLCHEIIWAPPLPKDRSRLIQDEIALVSSALHSRQTAMTNLGVLAPGAEIERMAVEGDSEWAKEVPRGRTERRVQAICERGGRNHTGRPQFPLRVRIEDSYPDPT
jgi:hypothetical protein